MNNTDLGTGPCKVVNYKTLQMSSTARNSYKIAFITFNRIHTYKRKFKQTKHF